MKPCPFCSADLESFGPDQFNHPRNDCWLSSVSIKADEFDAWNRRAELAAGAARQGGGTNLDGIRKYCTGEIENSVQLSGVEDFVRLSDVERLLGSAPAAGTTVLSDLCATALCASPEKKDQALKMAIRALEEIAVIEGKAEKDAERWREVLARVVFVPSGISGTFGMVYRGPTNWKDYGGDDARMFEDTVDTAIAARTKAGKEPA